MTEHLHGLKHGLTNYGDRDFSLYLRRSFAKSMGYSRDDAGASRWSASPTPPSGFNNCHRHFPELLEAVKRGVLAAGGAAARVPDHLARRGVPAARPAMKFRNLMAMDTEEMIRAQPMDAVVLMGGCDKTVPAQLMGAARAGMPAIQLVGRPDDDRRATTASGSAPAPTAAASGRSIAPASVDADEIDEVEGQLATTAGTCAVMGTASTMACIAEALGMIAARHRRDPGRACRPAARRRGDRRARRSA